MQMINRGNGRKDLTVNISKYIDANFLQYEPTTREQLEKKPRPQPR